MYNVKAANTLTARIELLQSQIDNMKAGDGFTLPGVTPDQQIAVWEREIDKCERKLARLATGERV